MQSQTKGHMNNWINLTKDQVLSRVSYSEDSESGLIWAEDHGGIRGKMYKKGNVAGKFSLKEYRIGIFKQSFSCSRLIYWLHHQDEDLDSFIVHHLDWNAKNNSLSNLIRVSIQEYRKLVIDKHLSDKNLPPSEFLDKKEHARRYRSENKEKIKETIKRWRDKNKSEISVNLFENNVNDKVRKMWQSAKERALKYNLPFEIQVDDIKIPAFCPILNIPLYPGTGKVHRNSPSLDRIIPELGYIPSNIWVISYRANTIKTNASKDELIEFSMWVLENLIDNN